MKAGLLLVQRLTLSWDKRCRGLADAKLRSGFPLAQPLTERPAGWRPPSWGESSKALLHQLHFFQQPGKILTALEENRRAWAAWGRLSPESCRERMLQREKMIMGSCYQAFDSIAQLSLPNICLQQEKAGLRVRFCHDGRTDLPLRRGRNEEFENPGSPFYRKDLLCETAFILCEGQYGRLCYNGRRQDYDSGQWYYLLQVFNFLWTEKLAADAFSGREPDKEYRQMADLF